MLQKKWWMVKLTSVVVVGLCCGLVVPAEKAPEVTKESPEEKAMQDMGLAYRLISYGRETQQPEALALAARILSGTKGKLVKQADAGKDAPEGEKLEKLLDANVNKLLDDAQKMVSRNPKIAAAQKSLIEQVRTDLGDVKRSTAVNGVQSFAGVFPAGTSSPQMFTYTFAANGKAASYNILVLTAADSGHPLNARVSNGAPLANGSNLLSLDTRNAMTLTCYTPKTSTGTVALTLTVTNGGNTSQPVVYLVTSNCIK